LWVAWPGRRVDAVLTPVAYLLLGRFITPKVEEEARLKRELEEAAYANMEPAE
jgi:HAE1 family hydrophobic/amphiphilic exporter-1